MTLRSMLLLVLVLGGCSCADDEAGGPGDGGPQDGGAGFGGSEGGAASGGRGGIGGPMVFGENDAGVEICQSIKRDADAIPPALLIVQDLSSSLIGEWQPLDDAMTQVAQTFSDRIKLGLVPFPTTYFKDDNDGTRVDSDCSIDAAEVIAPALGQGAAITASLDRIVEADMIGGTPTNAAMDVARDTLLPRDPDDPSVPYIILVTDGDPNCLFSSNPGQMATDMDRMGVTERVTDLAADGVNTYVVGYNFNGGILDTWADAGQTTTAFQADNTAELVSAMETISAGVAPCDYVLDRAVEDPTFVRVQIDNETVVYDDPDGWILSDDGLTVSLQGRACATLRDGDVHAVSVTVECEPVRVD